jgi:hypothetical protein
VFITARPRGSKLLKTMDYWCEWHAFIDRLELPLTFTLDELTSSNTSVSYPIVQRLFAQLRRPVPSLQLFAEKLRRTRHANSREHGTAISWEELACVDERRAARMWRHGRRYGFDVGNRPPRCAAHGAEARRQGAASADERCVENMRKFYGQQWMDSMLRSRAALGIVS